MPNDFQIFILATLAILDVAFTTRILRLGGSEMHPVMVWAQAAFSNGWGVVKYGVTVSAAIAWHDRPGLLWAAIAVMAVVVASNWRIMRGMRGA